MDESVNINYPDLSSEELEYWVRRAYREWFLRPVALWRILRSIRGIGDIGYLLRIAIDQFSWMRKSESDNSKKPMEVVLGGAEK